MPYDSIVEQPDVWPAPPPADTAPAPIAHWAHTLAICFVLLLTTLFGHARATSTALDVAPHAMRYTTTMLLEWLLRGSVIAGIYRRRDFFLASFRNREHTNVESLGLGMVVYLLGFMAVIAVGGLLYFTPLFHERNEAVVLAMLPHTVTDFVFWFGVSATAGVCEEVIFRGYLLRQLTAWTQRPVASIFIAALLFGSVHLYEGLGAILPLAALAVVYGFVVRHFKGDLRAVIIAHTLQDFVVAFIALAKPFLDRYHPK
jgi:membrane protease YdiL (CAAX protease family)